MWGSFVIGLLKQEPVVWDLGKLIVKTYGKQQMYICQSLLQSNQHISSSFHMKHKETLGWSHNSRAHFMSRKYGMENDMMKVMGRTCIFSCPHYSWTSFSPLQSNEPWNLKNLSNRGTQASLIKVIVEEPWKNVKPAVIWHCRHKFDF